MNYRNSRVWKVLSFLCVLSLLLCSCEHSQPQEDPAPPVLSEELAAWIDLQFETAQSYMEPIKELNIIYHPNYYPNFTNSDISGDLLEYDNAYMMYEFGVERFVTEYEEGMSLDSWLYKTWVWVPSADKLEFVAFISEEGNWRKDTSSGHKIPNSYELTDEQRRKEQLEYTIHIDYVKELLTGYEFENIQSLKFLWPSFWAGGHCYLIYIVCDTGEYIIPYGDPGTCVPMIEGVVYDFRWFAAMMIEYFPIEC